MTRPQTHDAAAHHLDITDQVCPMTFVRTKLAIEKLTDGALLEVRLNAGEPLENVPRSVTEMGHEVLSLDPDPGAPGTFLLRIRVR
ncbi:MAG: sulfurtransferase TusA family protein [Alphaproteobacteria bacterium]|jgi:tRNA 2-thiouridine synthesizing protein A|nr:sulfurtransferase TusA family protein [Alphaproteobacteria bacterium]MDP6518038.1 sulfurtransferase TusA family protein [Alphaproteobacteria bacterium]|tara:strand:+ start:409 stop:666 length:258 start_codon:yes stop_codon:yes gene_type:complete